MKVALNYEEINNIINTVSLRNDNIKDSYQRTYNSIANNEKNNQIVNNLLNELKFLYNDYNSSIESLLNIISHNVCDSYKFIGEHFISAINDISDN